MKKQKFSVFGVTVGIFLGIYTISIVAMFLWAINVSLLTIDTFDFDTLSLTKDWAFENYTYAYFKGFASDVESGATIRPVYIEEMFLNSILYAGGGALCQVAGTCLTAYLIARYDNKFSRFMHSVIIVTMILPIVGALPSQIKVFDALQMRNTFVGAWFMKFSFTNTYYLIFYGAFKSMSWGYAEAAYIDGANHFQIFFKIMLPLVSTLCGVTFIIFFITYWNDYQTPMLFLEQNPVLAFGLYDVFNGGKQYAVGMTPVVQITCGVIVLIPLLILFMIFKNKLMGNLTEGGLKG